MAKTYRPYVPEQDLLLPPSLREWLPEDHLAFFVSDLIDQLDLSAITTVYEDEERGYPPYHPVMLTKVLVYAYCVGVFSSRRIQRRLVEDIAFRVLAAGNEPDFRTIADFRKTHLIALRGFFEQVLRLARELGAPRVGRVALDGSKIKANASKHKAMSYGRMREKQRQLRDEVKQLLDQAEAVDAAEDAEYGPDRRGDELPAELQRRESRLKRIREAKRALEARAKEEAAVADTPDQAAKPDSKLQYNFTDPASRIMKGPDGFVQAYNVQAAVDELQLIVGHAVTQETNDKKQLMPMIRTIEQQSGDTPAQLLADAGYCSDVNLAAIADTDIDAYISTRKQKHGERPGPCPRGPLPTTATIVDRMSRKLHTKAGAAVYAARKGIVEPVIGQIKQARGFRQFLLRGFEKVQGEWSLVCTTHNILKLYRLCR
ncbi:MAG TPA: IS1182 family transposase [Vicinamibacterales bacterium]|jgi:transposase|nr:IS1182 family transposase [Vicinamibacterales bacterium]